MARRLTRRGPALHESDASAWLSAEEVAAVLSAVDRADAPALGDLGAAVALYGLMLTPPATPDALVRLKHLAVEEVASERRRIAAMAAGLRASELDGLPPITWSAPDDL